MPTDEDRREEFRARRAAQRHGLTLRRLRRPKAHHDNGLYVLSHDDTVLRATKHLEDVTEYLDALDDLHEDEHREDRP